MRSTRTPPRYTGRSCWCPEMILTVTLNASVDKLYLVEDLRMDTVMRVRQVSNTAGGKGLNVARVAALAGEEVRATGLLGGYNGRHVRSMLREQGIPADFVETGSETRCCVNVHNLSTGLHTEFLEPGAPVTNRALAAFTRKYRQALAESDVVTLSGSVPPGAPPSIYGDLVRLAKDAGKPVLLDTSGQLLLEGVRQIPTMIKPNEDELLQLLGRPAASLEELVAAAGRFLAQGIRYVVVSMGGAGAVMLCREGAYRATVPPLPVVNTVGCGDSMVAGFAVALRRGYGPAEMLRYAAAISAANALTMPTGFFEQRDLEALLPQIVIDEITACAPSPPYFTRDSTPRSRL